MPPSNDPDDPGQAWLQGHYGTKEMADAIAADIEKLAALECSNRRYCSACSRFVHTGGGFCNACGLSVSKCEHAIPQTEVARDREGGWNVWVWE